MSGSGQSTSPNFSGSASITATGSTINLGSGSGSLAVGGKPLDPTDETTLEGYSGAITVSANGDGTDSVSLNGDAGNVLQVVVSSATFTTDQNTPITFQPNIQTSLADTYNLTATAPPGWTVTIDSNGNVTATPAPGLQGGTYPIQIIAQSQTDSNLEAQTTVLVMIKPTQPGMNFTVASDPLFTVPFNGAQLPTAFRATIQNLGPTADTYKLTFSNVPSGFTLVESATSDTVPAGQTGIVGLYLVPNPGQPIPAQGTQLSFTVTATSTSNPSITQTQTETFTVPAIDALTITGSPTSVSTPPGAGVTDTITLTNVGNVPENNVTLTATGSSGLTVTGLAPVSLAVGHSVTETIMLTPGASTPLNSTLDTTITATFGPSGTPVTQTVDIPVQVVVPGAQSIASAAVAAGQIGNANLANRLSDLSIALTNLVQNPTSAVYRGQAEAALTSIISQVTNDAFLAPFASGLTAGSTAIASATTAAEVRTAVINLGAALDSLAQAITDEAAYGFTLGLTDQDGVIQPGAPTIYTIQMQNAGTATATYDFSVSGLPAGVTATFNQTSITLAPGASIPNGSATVTLSLSESGNTLIPADFTITATARGAQEITRATPGRLDLRPESLLVGAVVTNPRFTNPGGQVDVTAKIESVVNEPQQVAVSYIVTDVNGNVLVAASTPVTVPLTITSGLTTVDLGTFYTTGFADGADTIHVTVTDQSNQALPSATGQGSVTIGSPVTASLTVSPTTVPTGTVKVTNTVQIDSSIPLPDPLTVDGQTATTPATTVALYQDSTDSLTLAYVSGPNGIDIVNVSKPDAPVNLGAFDQGNIVKGGLTVGRVATIGGADYLIVGTTPQNSTGSVAPFALLIYSLAHPRSPQLVSDTSNFPRSLNGTNYTSGFLSDMVVQGNTVLVPTSAFHFFGIFDAQLGNVLAIDVSNPTAPQLEGVLFPGDNNPYSQTNQFGATIVNDQIAYIAGTTTHDGNTQNGVGRVLVVDYSNPTNPTYLGEVDIRGTYQILDVAVQGNQALVVGRTGGDAGADTHGTMTLSVLDITDPSKPQLVGTTLVTNAQFPTNASGVTKISAVGLGNGLFAVSEAEVNGNAELVLVNPSDPNNIVASYTPVTAYANEMAVSGNLLYATSSTGSQGLTIFNIGQLETIPVTVSVKVPNNTGVTIVPNSLSVTGAFNTALPQVVQGANFATVTWNGVLSYGASDVTVTWQSTVSNVGVGQVVPVTSNGSVGFVSQGTPGTVTLPGTAITGVAIISLSPGSQTEQPGGTATYDVQLTNPTDAPITYFVSAQITGNAISSINVNSRQPYVTVGPKATVDVPLLVTSGLQATPGDRSLTVTAHDSNNSNGASGSTQGKLTIAGQPVTQSNPNAYGVVAALTPSQASAGQGTSAQYVVQLTNTGSTDETFSLKVDGLPHGVSYSFSHYDGQHPVDVPPGASNFRDVMLTLTVGQGITPGSYPFSATAAAKDNTSSGTAQGTLTVVANGVNVNLNPSSGNPGSTFQLTVYNSGTVQDTFDLSLGGPAALVSSLATDKVTVSPGSYKYVAITTNSVNFADPGTLELTATATSEGNRSVQASATAELNIAPTQGMTAQFQQPTQVIPLPGTSDFLLLVNNTGNIQDSYSATITGTTGPVTASLTGLDGNPTQSIPKFILPGLSTGAILLQTDLAATGQGTVTIKVQSLSNPNETATATATVSATATSTPIQPVIQLTANPGSTTTYGQSVSFTATVGPPASGDPTPTGSVQFQIDGNNFGSPVTLDTNGSATSDAISTLTAVGHTITALYSGGPTYAHGSQTLTQTVNPATPTVNVTASNAAYNGAPTAL